jgi:enamine deaminase RidA (YjgF/YER057c/UK114 family)
MKRKDTMKNFTRKFALLAALALAGSVSADEIVRQGEGRLFFNTITIPAGAETLYLSGSGASRLADGSWGDTEQQTINTFEKFKATLEEQGWSMSDIVQVRVFGVAGKFNFDEFNRAYLNFFGTEENPQKPVRSVVEVAGMVVDGWVLEIEIRAARVPR